MSKIRTNKDAMPQISVMGKIHHPTTRPNYFRLDSQGKAHCVPATGGICFNIAAGDSVYRFEGDHLEPGISLKNDTPEENNAIMVYSCTGNKAVVVSGDAKGAVGYVLGGHGGIEHTIIEFSYEDKERMCIDDKIQIRACGQGLKINDFEDSVITCGIDPELLDRLCIEEKDGVLEVPVVATVPAYLMGSGLGTQNSRSGDYDIMTCDRDALKELGLDKLRFGDFVLIEDHTNTVGRAYKKGACTMGIIVHGDSYVHGHGPGVSCLLTSDMPLLKPVINPDANITNYM